MRCLICKLYDNVADVFQYICKVQMMMGLSKRVLYCIVLYCIVLYCIVLYCIVMYCIVLNTFGQNHKSTPNNAILLWHYEK